MTDLVNPVTIALGSLTPVTSVDDSDTFPLTTGYDVSNLSSGKATASQIVATGASVGVTVGKNGAAAPLEITGPAGHLRDIEFETRGIARWTIAANATAETGGNAGSDFEISGYDDSGADLGVYLSIDRSSGAVTIPGTLIVPGGISVPNAVRIVTSGAVIVALSSDSLIVVRYVTPVVVTVDLLSNPAVGQKLTIKDGNGSCGAFNITVVSPGPNIDAATTLVMFTPWASQTVEFDGVQWNAL